MALMALLRSHPGITSAVAGLGFALLLVVFGSRCVTPVGLALAALLGLAFGVAMYAAARRLSPGG